MKKSIKIMILSIWLIAITFTSILTNPTKEDCSSWVTDQLTSTNQSNNEFEEILVSFLGKPFIYNSISQKNFILFSLYRLNLGNEEYVTVIGLFNNFICLDDIINLY